MRIHYGIWRQGAVTSNKLSFHFIVESIIRAWGFNLQETCSKHTGHSPSHKTSLKQNENNTKSYCILIFWPLSPLPFPSDFLHYSINCLPFCLKQGYLVNWDVQRQVWEHTFGKEVMNLEPPETSIIITEPYFNFGSIQDAMNEVFFEEYQFQAIHRTNGKNEVWLTTIPFQ